MLRCSRPQHSGNHPLEHVLPESLETGRSTSSLSDEERAPLDVLGVGFGPSNLALAIALRETSHPRSGVHFYERHPGFSWHGGMLLKNATMQVHFLKDLVTLRNPRSAFTFLNYLHDRDRMVDFINHKALFPSRVEFHDYLEWAAGALADQVSYGHEVLAIEPSASAGRHELDVRLGIPGSDGGRQLVRRARNVVLAPGLRPSLPDGATESERVWHSNGLLHRLDGIPRSAPLRFTVVGAGQSAAEVTAHLHERFPNGQVRAVFAGYGYRPADDSSFANRIFDPVAVDDFHRAPHSVRDMLVDRHRNTNYSVVDNELISELYRIWYQEKVTAEQRLLIDHTSCLIDVEETAGSPLSLTVESLTSGEKRSLESDYLVYATGYRPVEPDELLSPELLGLCKRDVTGRLRVDRDYRIHMEDGVRYGIYLQGATEHTHGLSSTLLSNTAVRAGEVADSLLRHL
ncbi:lysine N(6)-hydroxylase/L-ornithine N(5)-oxygenase family protein [Streptomyces sp. NPDC048595]|uniref:lysine N(6)-hydroxylase/L-ornithine N(5)-oxygenase family protein n=1 Tax=Streptomyces sp. NPDC048595 TaxID=3365576 RepID=UPI003717EC5B